VHAPRALRHLIRPMSALADIPLVKECTFNVASIRTSFAPTCCFYSISISLLVVLLLFLFLTLALDYCSAWSSCATGILAPAHLLLVVRLCSEASFMLRWRARVRPCLPPFQILLRTASSISPERMYDEFLTYSSLPSRPRLPLRTLLLPVVLSDGSALLSSMAFLRASSSSSAARLFIVDRFFALFNAAAAAAAAAALLISGSRSLNARNSGSFDGGDFRLGLLVKSS